MLKEQQAREAIVEYGIRLVKEGLTLGTAGNLSIYDREEGLMAISPSGMAYEDIRPEDIVIMDLKGHVIDGNRKPSSEYAMHSAIYKVRGDVNAVVHAHSKFCTTLACMGTALFPVHYAIAEAGVEKIPLVRYETFGTSELADAVKEKAGKSKALLLANHGMLAGGKDMQAAFALALTMEWCAELQWRGMAAGHVNALTKKQMKQAIERYKSYGQTDKKGKDSNGYFG